MYFNHPQLFWNTLPCLNFILAAILAFICIVVYSAEIIGKVVGVSDGDTVTVVDNLDNGRFKICLYGSIVRKRIKNSVKVQNNICHR